MQPGDADVVEPARREAVGARASTRHSSATGRSAVPAATTSTSAVRLGGGAPVQHAAALLDGRAVLGHDGLGLVVGRPGQQHGRGAVGEQLADDAHALLGRLARPVHGLGQALAQAAVVVDEGVTDVGERQPAQAAHDLVGVDATGSEVVEQRPQRRFVHPAMLPDAWPSPPGDRSHRHRGARRQ